MNSVLEYALAILGAQAQEAIERAPSKYRNDVANIESFIKAVEKKGRELSVPEAGQMAKDLEPIFRELVNGLVSLNPSKFSFSWIFGGFDPFKNMRLAADKFKARWTLDWSR